MANKTLNTRIQNKRGTSSDWSQATTFKPLEGEIIVYTDINKIKIGNGNTLVGDLPFVEPTHLVLTATSGTITEDQYNKLMTDDNSYLVVNNLIYRRYHKNLPIFINTTAGGCNIIAINETTYEYMQTVENRIFEFISRKVPEITDENKTSTTSYPSVKAVADYVASQSGGSTPTNMVTTDTTQTITGTKTFSTPIYFNEYIDLACPTTINGDPGTTGQVLTSQGAGKTPIWTTPSKKIYEHNVRLACKSSTYYVYVFLRLYHIQATALTVSEVLSLLTTQTREASGFGMANVENLGTYKSVVVTGVSASSNWLYIDICSQNPYTTTAEFGNYSLDYASSSITISDTHIRQVN